MPMPSIVVVGKLFQLLVVSSMLLHFLQSQTCLSLSSWSRFRSQKALWVVFMVCSLGEEVTSSTKSRGPELLSSQSKLTSPSWSPSASMQISAKALAARPSLSPFLITGRFYRVDHLLTALLKSARLYRICVSARV